MSVDRNGGNVRRKKMQKNGETERGKKKGHEKRKERKGGRQVGR